MLLYASHHTLGLGLRLKFHRALTVRDVRLLPGAQEGAGSSAAGAGSGSSSAGNKLPHAFEVSVLAAPATCLGCGAVCLRCVSTPVGTYSHHRGSSLRSTPKTPLSTCATCRCRSSRSRRASPAQRRTRRRGTRGCATSRGWRQRRRLLGPRWVVALVSARVLALHGWQRRLTSPSPLKPFLQVPPPPRSLLARLGQPHGGQASPQQTPQLRRRVAEQRPVAQELQVMRLKTTQRANATAGRTYATGAGWACPSQVQARVRRAARWRSWPVPRQAVALCPTARARTAHMG
jgi:hypothetical protein